MFRLPQNKILCRLAQVFLSLLLGILMLGLIRQWIVRSEVSLEVLLPESLLELLTDLAAMPSVPPKMLVTEKKGKVKFLMSYLLIGFAEKKVPAL